MRLSHENRNCQRYDGVNAVTQLQHVPASHTLRGARILVASHTNTAVDRIMTGLVEAGCTGKTSERQRSIARLCESFAYGPITSWIAPGLLITAMLHGE